MRHYLPCISRPSRPSIYARSQLADGSLPRWHRVSIFNLRWKHDHYGENFTVEEVNTILRDKKAGKTFLEIASRLSRRVSACKTRYYREVKRTGAADIRPHKPFTAQDFEEVCECRAQNLTWAAIATKFGRSVRSLYYNRRFDASENFSRYYMPWSADEKKKIIHMRDKLSMPWADIAQKLGRTRTSTASTYYRERSDPTNRPRKWSRGEDQRLSTLQYEHSHSPGDVSDMLYTRTARVSRARYGHTASSSQSRPFSTLVPLKYQSVSMHMRTESCFLTRSSLEGPPRPTLEHAVLRSIKRCIKTQACAQAPRRSKRRLFTQEDRELILQRRREGVSFPDIATELGRDDIRNVWYTFNRTATRDGSDKIISRQCPLSASDFEEIGLLRASGMKWRDISQAYGKPPNSVAMWFRGKTRRALSQQLTRRPWSEAEVSHLLDGVDGHRQWTEIARQVGRSTHAVKLKYFRIRPTNQVERPFRKNEHTAQERGQIQYLREVLKMTWGQMQVHLPTRTTSSLQAQYYNHCWSKGGSGHSPYAPKHFTSNDHTLLLDLRHKQLLSWEAVHAKMSQWTVEELQNRYELLVRWPPPSTPSPAVNEN